jgi:glutathione S-transferase
VRHIWEGKLEGGAGGCAPASEAAFEAAHKFNALVCTPFYRILVRQDPGEQREAAAALIEGFAAFGDGVLQSGGPFFCGPRLSPADVAVAPWALRIPLLEHYRTWFELPTAEADPRMAAFRAWLAAVRAQPAVAATIADEAELRKAYLRYADGTAQSKVGDAIRAGQSAERAQ